MLSEKMAEALNGQINKEMYSAYIYLSMAAYSEYVGLSGFANWFMVQYEEENEHAMKLYDYVLERGGEVELSDIKAADTPWKTPLEVFEAVYAHELKVTSLINDLLLLARKEGDAATESMLKWFIDEQVEEEASSKQIVDKLKLIGDSANGLFILDGKLGERK